LSLLNKKRGGKEGTVFFGQSAEKELLSDFALEEDCEGKGFHRRKKKWKGELNTMRSLKETVRGL